MPSCSPLPSTTAQLIRGGPEVRGLFGTFLSLSHRENDGHCESFDCRSNPLSNLAIDPITFHAGRTLWYIHDNGSGASCTLSQCSPPSFHFNSTMSSTTAGGAPEVQIPLHEPDLELGIGLYPFVSYYRFRQFKSDPSCYLTCSCTNAMDPISRRKSRRAQLVLGLSHNKARGSQTPSRKRFQVECAGTQLVR